MNKYSKLLMLMAVMALLSFTAAFAGDHGHGHEGDDCNFDDQGEFNTDDNCGTASATCEWTFQMVCPAEVTCDGDVDLGTFCVGQDICACDDKWITFHIGGEVGRSFQVTVNVDENARDEDGNYDSHVVLQNLIWQRTHQGAGSTTWINFAGLSNFLDVTDYPTNGLLKIQTPHVQNGTCVSAEQSSYGLRVRPGRITTNNASAGSYSIRISLGVDFGYNI